MQWPRSILDDIRRADGTYLTEGSFDRFVQHIRGGIDLTTAFSGAGGDAIGVLLLATATALNDDDALAAGERHSQVTFLTATDKRKVCRRILTGYRDGMRPHHVFGDYCDRIPQGVRRALALVQPEVGGECENYSNQFEVMAEILNHCSPHLFCDGAQGKCDVHNGNCPLYPPQHGKLSIHWAGTICIDLSVMGSQSGPCGPYSKLFLLWVHERRKRQETLLIHECTPAFPESLLLRFLGDIYAARSIIFGPEDLGWWVQRPRKFTFLLHKERTTFANDISSFGPTFFRHKNRDCERGDMFFCTDDTWVTEAFKKMRAEAMRYEERRQQNPSSKFCHAVQDAAKRRVRRMSKEDATWIDLLGNGNMNRLRNYRQAEKQIESDLVVGVLSSMETVSVEIASELDHYAKAGIVPQVVNLVQNFGSKGGSSLTSGVPTLLTRSKLWSMRKHRLMMGCEAMLCQGIPIVQVPSAFPAPFDSSKFTHSQLISVAGNAIHSACAAALTGWALASLVPITGCITIESDSDVDAMVDPEAQPRLSRQLAEDCMCDHSASQSSEASSSSLAPAPGGSDVIE